jgi:hypothetical protein
MTVSVALSSDTVKLALPEVSSTETSLTLTTAR